MSTDQEQSDQSAADDVATDDEDKPRGTLFIMICFLIMLIAMWSWVYFEMIVG